jgi:UDP-glucose 4-epimerase
MKILVTGGTGYIGSHTVVLLLEHGYQVVIVDNFSNSTVEVIERIKQITNKTFNFYYADLRHKNLERCFQNHPDIQYVIHFAGLKAVKQSVDDPLLYYDNNVNGTLNLLRIMKKHNVKNLIFSSSATVYDPDNKMPVNENSKVGPINPYGRTKLMIEQMCKDISHSDKSWNFVMLRYFNPVGAHPSGLLGENPKGTPNNLMPYILGVMTEKRPYLSIFGNDYDTPDGTGIRDYVHILDLAKGHLAALNLKNPQYEIFNLGTGNGYSVLEVVSTMENVSGIKIPFKFVERRTGDAPTVYANITKANKILNWSAKLTLENMCHDAWKWKKNNDTGNKKLTNI